MMPGCSIARRWVECGEHVLSPSGCNNHRDFDFKLTGIRSRIPIETTELKKDNVYFMHDHEYWKSSRRG